MTVSELAMAGMLLLYGVIYWLTHDDKDAYTDDDIMEVE